MKRLAGYPHGLYGALMLALVVLLASGIALLPSMLEMRMDYEMPWRVAGDARWAAAVTHCAAGFLLAGMVGALLAIHVRIGWRRRLNRISGTALLALLGLMVLTALGIYYFGDDFWSRSSSVTHSCAGLLATPLFIWHVIKGSRLRRDVSVWKHTRADV